MLATWGFAVTGICFVVFGYTFMLLVARPAGLKLSHFSYAYYALAVAFVIWAIAAGVNDSDLLRHSVIVGDGFLLLGTLFMLRVWLGKKKQAWLVLATIVAAGLLYLRTSHFSPTPYMSGSVLVFNTQRAVSLVLSLVFVLVWLPVNIKVAKLVTHKIKQDNIASLYSGVYMTATLAALVFIAARRVATVIISFIAIAICAAMLIGSNIVVHKIKEHPHGTSRK